MEEVLHKFGVSADERVICTKTRQLQIVDREDGSSMMLAPTIYQSCMNPDEIQVYPLQISVESDTELTVENRYQKERIDLNKKRVEVLPWEEKIQKSDCLHCVNCGRCGW